MKFTTKLSQMAQGLGGGVGKIWQAKDFYLKQ